jgi:hypothetical protein
MAEVEVFVWHDGNGNITATGTPHPDMAGRLRPIAGSDRSVLRTKAEASQVARLHETHRVDVERRLLSPRPAAK